MKLFLQTETLNRVARDGGDLGFFVRSQSMLNLS